MSWFEDTEADSQEIAAERLLIEAAELICEALAARDVSRAELARRLSVPAAEITMRLRGTRNMTLRSLGSTLHALGYEVAVELRDCEPIAPILQMHFAVETAGEGTSTRPLVGLAPLRLVDAVAS